MIVDSYGNHSGEGETSMFEDCSNYRFSSDFSTKCFLIYSSSYTELKFLKSVLLVRAAFIDIEML